jgi:hypothetical protein
MRAEIHDDRAAYRRHRAGAIAFVGTILGWVPIGLMIVGLVRLTVAPEAALSWGPAIIALVLPASASAWLYGTAAIYYYRCPRCRRPADRVEAAGVDRSNVCYHCPRCAVIWDLGWGPGEPA